MVARTLNRIYSVAGDESNPYYDRQLSQSIGYVLDNISPSARSVEELEELVLEKSNSKPEAEKLLKQLKEACDEAWSKITAFDRLINSQAQGVPLTIYKEKRAFLEEKKLTLERKIQENNTLIERAQENIDSQNYATLNLTRSESINTKGILANLKYTNLNATTYM